MEQTTLTIRQWSPFMETSWCPCLFVSQLTQTTEMLWFSHTTTSRAKDNHPKIRKHLVANSHVDVMRLLLQASINLEYTFGLLHGTGTTLRCSSVTSCSGLSALHCLTGHSWPSYVPVGKLKWSSASAEETWLLAWYFYEIHFTRSSQRRCYKH